MNKQETLRAAFMRPVFSPRSEMSRYLQDVEKNKTSLAINIDKETLALLKNQFEGRNNKVDKINFVAIGLKILKSWQKDMEFRESRLTKYLISLFQEIQNKDENIFISWQQFNNLIIQKALNLKSLQTQDTETVSQLRHVNWVKGRIKPLTPVMKIVCMNKDKKIAYLCEESNKIEFLSMNSNQHSYKPLVLDRQDLMVEKTLVKRVKNQGSKSVTKLNYKKKVVVSGYNVTFLDMIHVFNDRYNMLITSSSDGLIRGWDLHSNSPVLAKQPQNEEQKMIHQFPVEIHCMAWDEINDILYCSANNSKIYVWMVKTDSEKELVDQDGHNSMISSIIMMPKLQFLATGDYDGKLVLWDTISMNKKYKYQQHTRSIVSMTFHQALILLFTASFDHSICVWNPYIPSLIYKISCNVNVIQVQIIPGTNYLAALDQSSNLKIRETSKFNLISTYFVDRPDDSDINKEADDDGVMKIQPTFLAVSDDPVRLYFGGHSIKCMQFNQNQALQSLQYFPSLIKYHPQKLKMYLVIRNSIIIWDILTGQLYDTLQCQSDSQITSMDLIEKSGKFVVGDSQGTIMIRKLQNGIKLAKLYKHRQKIAVGFIVTKQAGVWNQSVIVASFLDGEIVVFGKDQSYNYTQLRTFNIRKNFPNAIITAIEYEEKRNVLIYGTNTGDIVCMDVDKSRMTNHVETKTIEVMKFFIKNQIPSFLSFGKNSEIVGVYLPPHSKKFKASCNLVLTTKIPDQKVVAVAVCKLSSGCFLGFDNGTISYLVLNENIISNEKVNTKQLKKVQSEWDISFPEVPKDIALIVDQTVLVIIRHMKDITLISAKDGQILNTLPSFAFCPRPNFYQNPTCYYSHSSIQTRREKTNSELERDESKREKEREKERQKLQLKSYGLEMSNKHQFYLPDQKRYVNIDFGTLEDDNRNLKIFHDPYYLYENYVKNIQEKKTDKDIKGKLKNVDDLMRQENENHSTWNKSWRVFPIFKDIAIKNFQEIIEVHKKASDLLVNPTKKMILRNSVVNSQLERAVNAQKKWEKVKEEMEEDAGKTQKKMNLSLSTFKVPVGIMEKKNGSEWKDLKSIQQQRKLKRHESLHRNESSPFIRLGLALQKINEKDDKALKYIQMGERQSQIGKSLKLPRIEERKISNE